MLIELERVTKIYNQGKANEVCAVREASLAVAEGEMVCLRGPSGSGKSTLLAIIGCVIQPTSGRAAIAGRQLSRLPDRFLTIHRRQTVGFIFQQFNILPELTVADNIGLPLLPLGVGPAERRRRAQELAGRFGISHRLAFRADQVSGGELQRVAIARALVNDPPILLADEPTAHLDSRLSREFMAIMEELQGAGKTIIIASHDQTVTGHPAIDRIVDMKDGRLYAA